MQPLSRNLKSLSAKVSSSTSSTRQRKRRHPLSVKVLNLTSPGGLNSPHVASTPSNCNHWRSLRASRSTRTWANYSWLLQSQTWRHRFKLNRHRTAMFNKTWAVKSRNSIARSRSSRRLWWVQPHQKGKVRGSMIFQSWFRWCKATIGNRSMSISHFSQWFRRTAEIVRK